MRNSPTPCGSISTVFCLASPSLIQAWRDSVLFGNLKKAWNNPDELFNMIVTALSDGFRSDVVDAAHYLYKIDSNRLRATCIWGIILMDENRLDEAEKVLRHNLEKYRDNGVVLTNLAKVMGRTVVKMERTKRFDAPHLENLLSEYPNFNAVAQSPWNPLKNPIPTALLLQKKRCRPHSPPFDSDSKFSRRIPV